MMKPTRRQLLTNSALGVGLSSLMPITNRVPHFVLNSAEAASKGGKSKGENVFVVVQLSGGNDGLNTVIPYEHDVYHRSRGTLAINKQQVLKLNDEVGLHPSMGGMKALYESGRMCVIQGVGYPNPNRSHFESMDIWHSAETGLAAGRTSRTTGWLGRYLDAMEGKDDVGAIHIGGGVQPLALQGDQVRALSVRDFNGFKLKTKNEKQRRHVVDLASQKRENRGALLSFLQKSTVGALKSSQRLQDAMGRYKTEINYPGNAFGQKLKTIAQLIDAELRTPIYYISLDGFDTHAQQANTHNVLLGSLSNGLKAFMDDLKLHGHDQRVTVLVFSEFGRRVKENASAGTDHGRAAPAFVLGGQVKKGIWNEHPSMTHLDAGDLIHSVDFREIYAGVLRHHLGVNELKSILGEGRFKALNLWRA